MIKNTITLNRDTIMPSVRGKVLTARYTARAKKYAAVTTLEEGFVWARDKPAIGPWCMDIDGNVGVNVRVPSNANITIDSSGMVKLGKGNAEGNANVGVGIGV